jgi:hypothetical protein
MVPDLLVSKMLLFLGIRTKVATMMGVFLGFGAKVAKPFDEGCQRRSAKTCTNLGIHTKVAKFTEGCQVARRAVQAARCR